MWGENIYVYVPRVADVVHSSSDHVRHFIPIEENMNQNAVWFNNALLRAVKSPFPGDEEGFTTPSEPHS